ncbi:Non-heme dioxygenase N-terminal domain containing protein [Trema orientale]|uniref:Non-heme dioxygenase N-terminal domain containing protein n=1 Tax=Trema orientale TaxID=63057 RepID=A0A2P5F3S7_TREOI|nr:Non-heme dioxygenase N-terminal domain containing protein [Trema orientale]
MFLNVYKIPTSYRPSLSPEIANVPVVDLAGLKQGSEQRSLVIEAIRKASRRNGFFQVINHGICQSMLDGALSSAFEFFRFANFKESEVHV